MNISGKKVLVTGGGSGIGLAIANAFLAQGALVTICGRTQEKLDQACADTGGSMTAIVADIGKPGTAELLKKAVGRAGGIDILVNNAGIQLNYSFFDRSYEDLSKDIEHEIAINLLGPMKLTAALLPVLQASEGAAVINIGSVLGIAPKGSAAVYCASKAGIRNFSRTLRYQAEERGARLHVMDVLVPLVDTDMTAGRGSGKIPPKQVGEAVVAGLRKNRKEVNVGKVPIFRFIMRIAPRLGYKMLRGS
ncbi:3-oxoacyl-[acyl-carrier protein] reductase [hydrothermal vent metagenome]|uniref:3-oxoacyl-[acyl-carrier protein] reductase n=1 Tax=hydrothermal vent metagenome TaxID=652676 RepID=A0A3B0R8V6_9ZZZZ